MKTLVVLFMFIFITGCASLGGTYDKEKVQKVKKIALIGFSYDAPLETGDHMVSALMGNEQSSGPGMMAGQKWEKILPETPYSKEVYDQLVAGLKKDGWQVKPADVVRNSPSLKAFYNKSVKVGYLPLEKGDGRFERTGIPQYIHAASLAGKQEFAKIAKELGVDAVASAYVHAKGSQSIPLISTIHHSSTTMFQIYDPVTDTLIMNFVSNGPDVEGKTKTKIGKDFEEAQHKGTLAGVDKFSDDLGKKLKQ
jgi:hypothetical protein